MTKGSVLRPGEKINPDAQSTEPPGPDTPAAASPDAGGVPSGDDILPAGFDADLYLDINSDVAAVVSDAAGAAAHYRDYGAAELRALRPAGSGLDHPGSRMLETATERADWREVLSRMSKAAGGIDAVLAAHPRRGWLRTGFNLASYLGWRQDVAEAVDDPREAAFHFLEFGLEEGHFGTPAFWDPDFVATCHGLVLDRKLTALQALIELRATGADPLTIALDESEYWNLKPGFWSGLAPFFDHEYYHAMASAQGDGPASHDRTACIDHFCDTGIERMLPIHPDMVFDAGFYRGQLDAATIAALRGSETAGPAGPGPDSRAARPGARTLYTHWLQDGLRFGLWPNMETWAARDFGITVPPELAAELPVYRLNAQDLSAEAPQVDVLRHLLTHPRPALAALDLGPRPLVEFVVSLADRMTVSGDQSQAEWLYWLALDSDPDNGRALQHLADLLQRSERFDVVQTLRRRVPPGRDGGWNSIALAEISMMHGRIDSAAEQLLSLPVSTRGDVAMTGKARTLARQLFDRIWKNRLAHVAAYGVDETQRQLKAAMTACTPAASSAIRSTPVRRVALVGNDDLYQCKLYRVDQKAEQLRAAGFEVRAFSHSRDLKAFVERADDFDAVIFFRVAAFPDMIDAITAAVQQGLLTFYEIDDLVFDTELFPPPLESYAGKLTRTQYDDMACGVPLFEHAMELCDYGIASTGTLREHMAKRVRTGQVFEHRNALGRLHMSAIRHEETSSAAGSNDADAPLVIFYGSGTLAHKEDFHELLEPALKRVVDRHGDKVEIRLIGNFGAFRHLDPETDPVRLMSPVWDFEEFCALVGQADINLSVLSRTPVTDAKSEIKWMEAAMFAIPSVVSDTATYREVIEDGVTGFLCADAEAFGDRLEALVSDPELRRRVGEAARDKVMTEYSIEAMGRNLAGIFETLRPSDVTKKRLMVVNVFYPPQAIGGATRVVHDNVTLLREHYGDRYDIDVVCTLEGGRTPYEVNVHAEDGVRVWSITSPGLPGGDMEPHDSRMADVFARLVQRIRPDLVHFHCIQRLTASVVDVVRHREIPYVITAHDGWWISPEQFIIDQTDTPRLYDFSARFDDDFPDRARSLTRPLMGAEYILPVSEKFADIHRACHLPRVRVVENGVSGLPACMRAPSVSGRVRLAHIGGASRHKGFHLVRNALLSQPYDNLELLLIDHAMTPGTTRHETWGSTPVTISAKVPQSQISDLYGRIDVLLAPSVWPESYGLVVREALATGAWAVASDRGAIGSDVIDGQNGFVVDVADYGPLAAALARIDADPERYRKAPSVKTPIRTVREQVDELVGIYDEVIATHPVSTTTTGF